MRKVELTSGSYKVYWKHLREEDTTKILRLKALEGIPSKVEVQAVTICDILHADDDSLISRGYAFCSNKDVFSKDKGRKESLTKALRLFGSKSDRRIFWNTYRTRKIM